MQSDDKARNPDPPPPALRLRVRWRDGRWEPVKLVRLPSKALVEASLPAPERGGPPLRGVWFEGVDREGKVVLRRRVLEPLPVTVDRPVKDGELARAANPDGFLLDLLMPADRALRAVRLLARPDPFQPLPPGGAEQARVLAVFDLGPLADPDGAPKPAGR